MSSKFSDVVGEGLGDKVWASIESDQSLDISSSLLRLGGVVAYLNDVVTVVILDAIDDSAIEFSYESVPLILQDMLDSFLDNLLSASPRKGRLTLHPYISIESLNTFPSILPAISTFWD
jgi:hypothetical protein